MSGSILKQRREELGLDIREISELLKIKLEYLSAIENDLFDKLPAPVYTRGYIRSYSKYLSVDPADIIKLYSKQLPPPKTDATIMPVILDNGRKKPKTLYIAATLLAIAAGLVIYLKMPHTATDNKPSAGKVEATGNKEAIIARNEKKQAEKIRNRDNPQSETADGSDVRAEKKPGFLAPAYTNIADSTLSSEDKALHRLSLKAIAMSWVYVKFRNGKHEEITLKPGQTKEWSFLEGVSVKIGNAGGIQVILDGKDIGPVGTKGQVVVLTFPQTAD